MKAKKQGSISICNVICVISLAILLILQFTPFWELNGSGTSIGGYVWLPLDHPELTAYLQSATHPDFKVDTLVMTTVCQTILSIIGVIVWLRNRESIIVSAFAAVCGIGTMWSFLSKPALQLGVNWYIYLILGIVLLVFGIIGILTYKKQRKS